VTGYDRDTNHYHCVDSYFTQNPDNPGVFRLPESDLKNGFKETISFSLNEYIPRYSVTQVLQEVQLGAEDFETRKYIFEDMAQFGRDLAEYLDIDAEMEGYSGQIQSTKLYRQLIQYGQRRQNFAGALRFLKGRADDVTDETADVLDTLSSEFERAAGLWKTMGVLMMKLYLAKKEAIRKTMGDLTEQIAGEELVLFRKITDVGRID